MLFKKYERYKDSGVKWIGEVPEHWEIARLKNITKAVVDNRGRTPEFGDSGIPMLEVKQITEGGKYPSDSFEKYVEPNIVKQFERDKVSEGDILISTVGATSGKASLVPLNPNFFIAQNVIGIRPTDQMDSLFIYYMLASDYFHHSLQLINKANTIDNLKVSIFINNTCILPPLSEQKEISKFLDQKTSEIDFLIADKEKLIELLQERRQAVISEAVTKGLDKNVKMKDSGIEWIGEVPEHWEIIKIKYVTGINLRSLSETTEEGYEIQYIDIGNVNSNGEILEIQSFKFKDAPSRARRIIIDGDTIVSTVRTYLKAITWIPKSETNLVCSTGFAVLSPQKGIVPQYLAYLMRSSRYIDEIVARSVGISYPAINASDLGSLECLLPPLEEQRLIIRYIDNECFEILALIKDIQQQINRLKEYRQSLISEVVTGKIVV